MSDRIRNNLEIYCPDEGTMSKIKKVIFDYNEKNEVVFTMKKLLPRPDGFCENPGYTQYGSDWSYAMWGTKWDVHDYTIMESGDTISIDYITANGPNNKWSQSLCDFIQETFRFDESEKVNSICINHKFHYYPNDLGGILEWKPGIEPELKIFSFMEYAKLYDPELFEFMTEVEKGMKENPGKMIVIEGY